MKTRSQARSGWFQNHKINVPQHQEIWGLPQRAHQLMRKGDIIVAWQAQQSTTNINHVHLCCRKQGKLSAWTLQGGFWGRCGLFNRFKRQRVGWAPVPYKVLRREGANAFRNWKCSGRNRDKQGASLGFQPLPWTFTKLLPCAQGRALCWRNKEWSSSREFLTQWTIQIQHKTSKRIRQGSPER